MSWLVDFVSLIYPHQCVSCDKTLYDTKNCICISCQFKLPKTNFHLDKQNTVAKIFWGKVPLEHAAAYYYFNKGDKVQKLVHGLKYKNLPQVGVETGVLYGNELKTSSPFNSVDFIIPVPLHSQKLLSRGYNQAESFGVGLAQAMEIECRNDILIRKKFTETQTKKSQFERWLNVDSVFAIEKPAEIEGKHLLLVDDVVTTGSTLEACAQLLLQVEGVKVSIACMAFAQ